MEEESLKYVTGFKKLHLGIGYGKTNKAYTITPIICHF